MSEPEIITYGRQFIKEYKEQDFIMALKRAFIQKGAHYIILDSHPANQKFLAACAAWSLDKGLIYNDVNVSDSQGRVSTFRRTGRLLELGFDDPPS